MDIDGWRDEIDRVDEKLVELLNRRAQCAIEIGRIKRRKGLPVYSPEREVQVVTHVAEVNAGPLESAAIRRLFERIIDESRSLERATVEHEGLEGGPSDDKNEEEATATLKARNPD